MSEVDKAFNDRRENLLNKIDYAIGIINNVIEHPEYIDLNENNLENMKEMLTDIEKEIKELIWILGTIKQE